MDAYMDLVARHDSCAATVQRLSAERAATSEQIRELEEALAELHQRRRHLRRAIASATRRLAELERDLRQAGERLAREHAHVAPPAAPLALEAGTDRMLPSVTGLDDASSHGEGDRPSAGRGDAALAATA